jgi:malonyl-CoA/methylmalonyl-CoA synthetase
MTSDLFAKLHAAMIRHAERPALRCPGMAPVSYGDLDRASARLSGRLMKLGVTPGARVAVQVEKSVANVVLYLACLRAGAVYLPLNTAYTESELGYFFGDAEPALIVVDPARRAAIRRLDAATGVAVETLDAAGAGSLIAGLEEEAEADPVGRMADDLAAILYTSGTTGRSKGAMITHRNLIANAETLIEVWGISDADLLLHALPIYHVHGLFVALNTSLLAGATMLFLPKFDAGQVIGLLPEATTMMGVPTFYTRLLAHPGFTAEVCRGMRLFISGSAPLLDETFQSFEARTGKAILERYGMTETGMLCSNPLDGARRPGTVGPPLPDVRLRVADEDGRQVAECEPGILEVKGPNVFEGYWRMPEKTAEEFRADGWFITGDIGRIDPDGYVRIVGRAKDLIISGGYNVYPKEVEAVIDRLPGIGESAVIGLAHPDFGEAVAAVVTATGTPPVDEAALIAAARQELAAFKVPKRVFVVDQLPRNSMGKVQKNQLRDRDAGTFAG